MSRVFLFFIMQTRIPVRVKQGILSNYEGISGINWDDAKQASIVLCMGHNEYTIPPL